MKSGIMKQGITTWAVLCLLPCLLLCQLFTGCGNQQPDDESAVSADPGVYTVTTTVGMVTDIVQLVAGERAVVKGLMGEGVDPHTYQPTRDDMAALRSAHVVFYAGLFLESNNLLAGLESEKKRGRPVFAVTHNLPENKLFQPTEGHPDPHVWMDVQLWIHAVHQVVDALSGYDAPSAAHYQENGQKLVTQLEQLDIYARNSLATIPEERRTLITAHDAFSYFGRAYEVEVHGIQGISTASQAGLKDINLLVDLLVEKKIQAVFVESSVADKFVMALVEGAASRDHKVIIGGKLFSDAMGAAGTYEGTYLGMIDHNVTTIVRALGGEAPEKGRIGKLKGVSHD